MHAVQHHSWHKPQNKCPDENKEILVPSFWRWVHGLAQCPPNMIDTLERITMGDTLTLECAHESIA
eukprot:4679741-Amphidinium_carterae.1